VSIGFVVQPQGVSLEPLVDAARTVGAGLHVVIDEAKAVPAFQALGAQVIYRRSDDDHAHEKFDPGQFVESLHAAAPAGALLHLGNEPGRQSLARLNQWTLEALRVCDRVGRKGVFFNFATGEPEPSEWTSLRDTMDYAYTNSHSVGLHEYFDGTIVRSAPWHIGRFKNVYTVFGMRSPKVTITELGCAINYDPYAGWQTYHTEQSYGAELVTAMRQFYAPYHVPTTVFILGYWDRTATFDVRGQTEIFRMMAEVNTHVREDDDVAGPPGWKTAVVGPKGVNLRPGPGIKYTPVAVVMNGDWVRRLPGSEIKADGWTWIPVALEKNEATHIHGWAATEVLKV
jgi:hypothetical protein